MVKSFVDSEGRYGYRRVHVDVNRWGAPCTAELVRDLMRELGLVPCQPRRSRKGTTRQAAKFADIPDLVQRDFTSTVPGAKLVGDITYVHTWQGGWAIQPIVATQVIEEW